MKIKFPQAVLEQCHHCGRFSTLIAEGHSCPWCGRKTTRWLRVADILLGAIGMVAVVGGLIAVLWMLATDAEADFKITTGMVNGESVRIIEYEYDQLGITQSTGTIGDRDVDITTYEYDQLDITRSTGTIGDELVDIYRFGWDDPETEQED
jgi:hypothetical protein